MRSSAPAPSAAERLMTPILEFLRQEAAGGLLLMAMTVVALAWANSPFGEAYQALWQTRFSIGLGSHALDKPLLLWINDGLMAVFFFVVGLEIKREVLGGELASLRQAALPMVAALGGMVVPALLYAAFNAGGQGASGWGIPMATDIAFALGVLALLGKRVPLSLKIFLAALAIVDDIGAVLVIALFYTSELAPAALGAAALLLVLLVLANRLGLRHPLIYLLLGAALWVAVLKSGIHATVAGVLLAMTIPASSCADPRQLAAETESPLQRLEHTLHPWVAFLIMPVFALANAGVELGQGAIVALTSSISLGVVAGLVIGKPAGILAFVWLGVRAGWLRLPTGVGWSPVIGVACLAGIGFTMSLFIAGLAFDDAAILDMAKTGIMGASLIAGVLGWLILRRAPAAD